MLYLNHYKMDWTSGKIERLETIFLHDPDRRVPFRIVHEDTQKRYLTGSDFDTEGFQIIADSFWIGDEFGPYILKGRQNRQDLGRVRDGRRWQAGALAGQLGSGNAGRAGRDLH